VNVNNDTDTAAEEMEVMELERLIGISSNYNKCVKILPTSTSTNSSSNENEFIHSIGSSLLISDFSDSHSQHIFTPVHRSNISCLSLTSPQLLFASGDANSLVCLWDLRQRQLLHDTDSCHSNSNNSSGGGGGGRGKVNNLLFTPDAKFLLATFEQQGLLVIWDIQHQNFDELIIAKQINNNNSGSNSKCSKIDAIELLKMEAVNNRHNLYSFLFAYNYHLFEWRLAYSVKSMQYELQQVRKFHYPPNQV
jgi:WD40 repeat protein